MGLPRKLKNFVLFNEGSSYLGEVEAVTLPKLTRKLEDYRAGGMNGPVKLDHGMEGLELSWTAGGILFDVLGQWGVLTHNGVGLRFAGALQRDDSEEVDTIELVVRGRHAEIDLGESKAGEKTEFKVKSVLSYYKLSINGVTLIEVDLVNMVEVVGGVDRLAAIRTALGI